MSVTPRSASCIAAAPNHTATVGNTQRHPALTGDQGAAFVHRDVSVVAALAVFAELDGQPRRAAQLRAIGHRIALELAGHRIPWALLDAGRVGFMAVAAARDSAGFDLIERARGITRRITTRAVGAGFDLVSIAAPDGARFTVEG